MSEKLMNAYIVSQFKWMQWKEAACGKIREAITDETGDVNVVAIVVLIGVAVGLALLFKDKIAELLETLFGKISEGTDGFTSNPNGK